MNAEQTLTGGELGNQAIVDQIAQQAVRESVVNKKLIGGDQPLEPAAAFMTEVRDETGADNTMTNGSPAEDGPSSFDSTMSNPIYEDT